MRVELNSKSPKSLNRSWVQQEEASEGSLFFMLGPNDAALDFVQI